MKTLMLLLMSSILVACANVPEVPIPNWEVAEREDVAVTEPEELPALCEMPWTDPECWRVIAAYEIVAESNTEIAQANADALKKTEAAYDHLVEAGKMQQQYAHLREEQLREERSQRLRDLWYYRGLLVIGGVLAVSTN